MLARAEGRRGGQAFARQLCWRDFHHQVLAARPDIPHADYRGHGDRWRRSKRLAEAWREGRTGYPIVDAGMRQLAREGFMHNRARMIVASFLTKTLYFDPEGTYVRRYVPELSAVAGGRVHEPWLLAAAERRHLDYPAPLVDHEAAAIQFKSFRESGGG